MIRLALVSISVGLLTLNACTATHSNVQYKGAAARADEDYMLALRKCDAEYSGDAQSLCRVEAKATKIRSVAEAKATYLATAPAVIEAQRDKVEADHLVAREKCNSLGGDAKQGCIAEAKSARDSAMGNIDAVEQNQEAEWKAALERCSELGGTYRSTCMAEARAKYAR